jgi:hypothetical protein
MEIITGVERRRRWRDEEKLRILGELDEPGAKFMFIRSSGAVGCGEVPAFRRFGQAAWRTRLRSRSNLARPYMPRLMVLSRLT